MHTNIDQLHHVVMNKPPGRWEGKTLSRCHELAASVELGNEFIVCEIEVIHDLSYLRSMIERVFDDHGISLAWIGRTEARARGSRILFMIGSTIEERTRGIKEYGYVNLCRHA